MSEMSSANSRDELLFEMYKIILADEWHQLSKDERRDYIKRMFYSVYGAYDVRQWVPMMNKVVETDIYKWAEDEGVFDESNVDRQRFGQGSSKPSNSLHKTNLRSRAMSLLRTTYQRFVRAVTLR